MVPFPSFENWDLERRSHLPRESHGSFSVGWLGITPVFAGFKVLTLIAPPHRQETPGVSYCGTVNLGWMSMGCEALFLARWGISGKKERCLGGVWASMWSNPWLWVFVSANQMMTTFQLCDFKQVTIPLWSCVIMHKLKITICTWLRLLWGLMSWYMLST